MAERIMVVDDDFDILTIVRRTLEKWGYTIDTFSNPLHALEVFKGNSANYSLVLMDVRMPEISGISLAAMLRKVRRNIKIIVMTAYELSLREIETNTPDLKPISLLGKPFTVTKVCETVKKSLQGQT